MTKPLLLTLLFIACIGGCDINDDFCSQPCPTDDTFDGFHLGPGDIDGHEVDIDGHEM